MTAIKVADLHPAGSELFHDSESFLFELTDEETLFVEGGKKWGGRFKSLVVVNINITSVSVFTANGNTINANTIGGANTAIR